MNFIFTTPSDMYFYTLENEKENYIKQLEKR